MRSAVALEDRRDHPRRRGLAVRADDVDRAEALARASRAPSSGGACGPGRSACRTARARAGSARPPRRSSATTSQLLQLGRQRASLSRSACTTAGGALATKPSLASLPSARAISVSQLSPLARAGRSPPRGRRRRRARSRRCRRGSSRSRAGVASPVELEARQPGDVRRRSRRSRRSSRAGRTARGGTPTLVAPAAQRRHGAITRATSRLGLGVDAAPRRPRRAASARAGPRRPGRRTRSPR